MAEALAALSIVANVMQVISFSYDVGVTAKRIYDNKSPARMDTQSLDKLTTAIRQDLSSLNKQSERDKALDKVAEDVLVITGKIKKILQAYEAPSNSSDMKKLAKGLGKALKYNIRDKKNLEELKERLNSLRGDMETHILVGLRQQIRDQSITTSAEFTKLDQTVQDYTKALVVSIDNFKHCLVLKSKAIQDTVVAEAEATRSSNTQEAAKTRHHVSGEMQTTRGQMQKDRAEDLINVKREQFLQSLRFPQMNARASKLGSDVAYHGTFEWVFGIDDDREDKRYHQGRRTWDDLTKWLQNDEAVYWISGKPGSGKSTFMRFLVHDPRTLELLSSGGAGAFIISAYIWAAGSYMQRSLQGILCALLYALLSHAPGLFENIIFQRYHDKRSPDDWSTTELERLFSSLVGIHAKPMCVFVDGLDEIDSGPADGQTKLLSLMSRLSALDSTKVCLASRPEPVLYSQLCDYPHLKLQDLTRRDIVHLVTTRLRTPSILDFVRDEATQHNLTHLNSEYFAPSLERLVDTVANRADGIFLWVCLVTEGILRGVFKCDSWEMLLRCINHLPVELGNLYEDLWKRQQEDAYMHPESVALYLNTILELDRGEPGVLEMQLIANTQLCQRLLAGGTYVSNVEMLRHTQRFQQRVIARCCGLVDSHYTTEDLKFWHTALRERDLSVTSEAEALSFLWEYCYAVHARFCLIHRSARDFLLDSVKGQEILNHDRRKLLERASSRFLGRLATTVMFEDQWDATLHAMNSLFNQHSISRSLRDCALDLCTVSNERIPRSMADPCKVIGRAIYYQCWNIALGIVSRLHSTRTLGVVEDYSRLLTISLGYLWMDHSPDGVAQEFLTWLAWLLEHGADPNLPISNPRRPIPYTEIVSLQGDGWNLPALLSSLYLARGSITSTGSIKQAWIQVQQTLSQYNLNTSSRFLISAGPASNIFGFARLQHGNEFNIALPDDVAVLVDMSYPHFMNIFGTDLQVEGTEEVSEQEPPSCLDELFNPRDIPGPRAVMLVRVDWDDSEEEGKYGYVTGVSGKLIDSAQSPPFIINRCPPVPWSTSISPPDSTGQGDMDFFDAYPNEVLEDKEIVEWLVKQSYLPESALLAQDFLQFLVDRDHLKDTRTTLYELDRSGYDYSYHPEYDSFIAALNECLDEARNE